METDDDNKMSYVEILNTAMELNEQLVDENIVRAFRTLELGQTGCVSCGEILEAMDDPLSISKFCDEGDLNPDGHIGFQEFKLAVHRLDQNSEGFKRIMSLGREEEEDEQSASLTSQNVSTKSVVEVKKSAGGSGGNDSSTVAGVPAQSSKNSVATSTAGAGAGKAHSVSPPAPPANAGTTTSAISSKTGADIEEADESGSKKMKFHRPSLIKALFPKDKDK